ncbi:MAG: TraB/GumN family protein [Syntrophaceae bacterium]|nr:TraB/GumN family protein [Syntrophaceae bacterium]
MIPAYLKRCVIYCVVFFALLFWSLPLYAQDRDGKSCLFKVTAPGSTVYLMGSIHFMREANYPLRETIERAFAASSNAVFEVNMAEMNSPDTQVMMLSQSVFTDGNTLEKSLSPATYKKLGEKTAEFGLDVGMLANFKPWSVAMTLMGLKLNQLGFDPAQGVDHYFYGKALAAGKKTFGLETLGYQIGLFNSLSLREQESLVEQTLNDFDTMEAEMGEMLLSWTRGDVENLESLLLKSFDEYPGLYQKFLLRRNRNWLSQIEVFLSQKKTWFVVIGAAHLLGPDGLVNLLRKRGYQVEQM